jgi:hypothetical protein
MFHFDAVPMNVFLSLVLVQNDFHLFDFQTAQIASFHYNIDGEDGEQNTVRRRA